jgi:hypothetical protein
MDQQYSETFKIIRAVFIADSLDEQNLKAKEDVIPDKFKKDYIQNS